jgi:mannosylglucosylglycerate synthase
MVAEMGVERVVQVSRGEEIMAPQSCRIGLVATRLEGTDGVSLETEKWVRVLRDLGHECSFFAGSSDWDPQRTIIVPEAHFHHPRIQEVNEALFVRCQRTPAVSAEVGALRGKLHADLCEFIQRFSIDLLIVENALSLPMNVPLGLALTELIAESEIPTIAHHHDFVWERTRFLVNAAEDYLQAAFPPVMTGIHNVVINSYAATELARRTGMRSTIVPNVMDFDAVPPAPDGYRDDLRRELGIDDHHILVLQPTRIVPRKRVELAVMLVKWLGIPATLVISHKAGDEGMEYQAFIERLAESLEVPLVLAHDRFAPRRATTPEGRKVYDLADAYLAADLVTYPSLIEGFGNALVEAMYYRNPVVMSRYAIYQTDIRPKGFEVIEFDDFVSDTAVEHTRQLLRDPDRARAMTDRNFELGRRYFSFTVLRKRLKLLIDHLLGQLY